MRDRFGAAALFLALALVERRAAAQTDVLVDYPDPAPADCPAAAVFERALTTRSSHVRVSRTATPAPKVVVRVTRRAGPHGAEVHGELSITYPEGAEATRVVDGKTCDAVVDALALMSAMALEATLAARAEPAPPPPPPEPPPAPPPEVPPEAAEAVDLQQGAHLAAGVAGGPAFGVAPAVLPNVAAFLELSRGTTGLFAPSVRASFDYAPSGTIAVTGGAVTMSRTALELDGCPLRWAPAGFRLSPCLHLEAGSVAAAGVDVVPVRSASRPSVAAGILGRVSYVLGRRFFVEVSGGGVAPLVRDRFYFEKNTPVFRAPALTGLASAAAGVTIL